MASIFLLASSFGLFILAVDVAHVMSYVHKRHITAFVVCVTFCGEAAKVFMEIFK